MGIPPAPYVAGGMVQGKMEQGFHPAGNAGNFGGEKMNVGKTDKITDKRVGKTDFFVFLPLGKRTNYD